MSNEYNLYNQNILKISKNYEYLKKFEKNAKYAYVAYIYVVKNTSSKSIIGQ